MVHLVEQVSLPENMSNLAEFSDIVLAHHFNRDLVSCYLLSTQDNFPICSIANFLLDFVVTCNHLRLLLLNRSFLFFRYRHRNWFSLLVLLI